LVRAGAADVAGTTSSQTEFQPFRPPQVVGRADPESAGPE
jgi:hypothetical protein